MSPVRCLGTLILLLLAGCANLDLTPSSVETWSGPPFPADEVVSLDLLPVVDVRTIDRGASVLTANLVREAATSLLREKGYAVSASGDALAATASTPSAAAALDVAAVSDRSPNADAVVFALAVEETSADLVVAPATVRVALRGVVVDVAGRALLWSGASVAEAGGTSAALAISPTATLYSAVYQAMRALLADFPARPIRVSMLRRH